MTVNYTRYCQPRTENHFYFCYIEISSLLCIIFVLFTFFVLFSGPFAIFMFVVDCYGRNALKHRSRDWLVCRRKRKKKSNSFEMKNSLSVCIVFSFFFFIGNVLFMTCCTVITNDAVSNGTENKFYFGYCYFSVCGIFI